LVLWFYCFLVFWVYGLLYLACSAATDTTYIPSISLEDTRCSPIGFMVLRFCRLHAQSSDLLSAPCIFCSKF
jgi:hypothetical protein